MSKLMSIVILNWNRLHYTKQTLECIIEKTTVPHELIFVDNGSVDGTREYLKDMENKTNAENFIRSAIAPLIKATVMPANIN